MTYSPSRVPTIGSLEELRQFVETELRELSRAVLDNNVIQLNVLYVAPTKPRDGMIVYADGSVWNPGSGAGFYGRQSGAWVKL